VYMHHKQKTRKTARRGNGENWDQLKSIFQRKRAGTTLKTEDQTKAYRIVVKPWMTEEEAGRNRSGREIKESQGKNRGLFGAKVGKGGREGGINSH